MDSLKNIISEIILASSIHGIPGILRTRRKFLKMIWAISFLLSAIMCSFMLLKSISEYFEYQIVTTTTVKTDIPAEFPKITICNTNPFMTDDALKFVGDVFSNKNDNWNDNGNKDYWEFYPLNSNQSSLSKSHINMLMSKLVAMSKAQNKRLTNEFRQNLGLSINDMLISCFFTFRPCKNSEFEWFFDSLNGNCFKFNHDLNDIKKVSKEGMLNGLTLEIFAGMPKSVKNLGFSSGISLFINKQKVTPSPLDGFDISTGMQTNIHLDKIKIKKIYEPYGECTNDLTSNDSYDSELYRKTFNIYNGYRQKDCINICGQEEIIKNLGCYSALLPHSDSHIEPCLDRKNIEKAFGLYTDIFFGEAAAKCLKYCPLECDSETYSLTSSFLNYPTKIYTELLLKENVFLNIYGNKTPTFDEIKNTILKLNINYKELQYTLIEESQKTTIIDLVSNIGGTLGLFLGFSFLSTVELVEIFFEVVLNFRKTKNSQKKIQIESVKKVTLDV